VRAYKPDWFRTPGLRSEPFAQQKVMGPPAPSQINAPIQPIPAAAILILCIALIFNVTAVFYILLGLITLFYLPRTKTKFVTDAPIIFILEFAHLVGFGGAILRNNFNTKKDLGYE
jgi:hypothetical protein